MQLYKVIKVLSAIILTVLGTTSMPNVLVAQEVISKDVAGLKDPVGIKRMEGSILILGESKKFDEFVIPLQKVEFDYTNQKMKEWNKLRIEGSRDTVFYRLPGDASTLEVARSYEEDLKAGGFAVVYQANAPDLDDGYGRFMKEVYGTQIGSAVMEYHLPASKDFRYVSMKKTNDDGSETYVAGLFAKIRDVWGSKYAQPHEVVTRLDVIRTKALTSRLVVVKAEEMPNLFDSSGKVVLYGILFDFNQASIKPESTDTLAEVGKFLSAHPGKKLIVSGHTDSVGSFEFNRELSQKRSEAVVEYLVKNHQAPRERFIPFGASFAAPVASNATEDGRAKNRRVELVQFD
jgi:outer membrane protein OmpA-like peptidoglycan-associated protein